MSKEQKDETRYSETDILPNRLLSALLLRTLPNKTISVQQGMSNVTPEIQSAELSLDGSVKGVSVSLKNLALKNELWSRGYYVNEIKRGDAIEYLVVSTAQPLDGSPIDHNAN